MNARIKAMRAYKERIDRAVEDEQREGEREQLRLEQEIKKLYPRILTLLETANEAIKCGIKVNLSIPAEPTYNDRLCQEGKLFVTDGIHHTVGFYQRKGCEYFINSDRIMEPGQYHYVGIRNGGACGCWDFVTDGLDVVSWHEKDSRTTLARREDMERFLKEFDAFERNFYEYIDKIIL